MGSQVDSFRSRFHPDNPDYAEVFRVDFSAQGGPGAFRVIYSKFDDDGATSVRLLGQEISLRKRPGAGNPRPLFIGTTTARAAAPALRRLRRLPR